MELWIRSQSKEDLIKVSNIRSYDNEICTDYGYLITLGNYETKERALEILDEIQKLLKPQIILRKGKITGCFEATIFRESDGYDIKELSTYVYEMPEE